MVWLDILIATCLVAGAVVFYHNTVRMARSSAHRTAVQISSDFVVNSDGQVIGIDAMDLGIETAQDLGDFLKHEYPDLEAVLETLPVTKKLKVFNKNDKLTNNFVACTPHPLGSLFRVTETGMSASQTYVARQRRDLLRDITTLSENIPYPVWKSDKGHRTCLSNPATQVLVEGQKQSLSELSNKLSRIEKNRERIMIKTGQNPALKWFDLRQKATEDGHLNYAIDVTTEVQTEISQRNFVQTLTKTFAHLSIGLAIFDKSRQLVLFNPALVDLTALPAEFLSGRPNLMSVFDRLRDAQIMPEPKDYGNWRETLAMVVAAASEGTYSEVWNLPNGRIYRISGRPHPNGAIAFLFEDISAEISTGRRYASKLELYQNMIDCLPDAMAVFSGAGRLIVSNQSYDNLWGTEAEEFGETPNIINATQLWSQECHPTPSWGDIRDFVISYQDRAAWETVIHRKSGASLTCQLTPIMGDATLIRFAVPAQQIDHARRA